MTEEALPLYPSTLPGTSATAGKMQFMIEISISRETLILYEKNDEGRWVPRREYKVGTAVQGIDTYPLGKGKVTPFRLIPGGIRHHTPDRFFWSGASIFPVLSVPEIP